MLYSTINDAYHSEFPFLDLYDINTPNHEIIGTSISQLQQDAMIQQDKTTIRDNNTLQKIKKPNHQKILKQFINNLKTDYLNKKYVKHVKRCKLCMKKIKIIQQKYIDFFNQISNFSVNIEIIFITLILGIIIIFFLNFCLKIIKQN